MRKKGNFREKNDRASCTMVTLNYISQVDIKSLLRHKEAPKSTQRGLLKFPYIILDFSL